MTEAISSSQPLAKRPIIMRVISSSRPAIALPIRLSRATEMACCVFVGILFIGGLQLVSNIRPPNSFSLTHWKWDYSLGLIRRGLFGTVLNILGITEGRTPVFVLHCSIGLFIVCLLAYGLFAALVVHRWPSVPTCIAALSGVALAPALPEFAYDLGRPEQLNFVILIATIVTMHYFRGVRAALVISVLCSIGILIHEGFLLLQLPLICALYLASAPDKAWGARRFPLRLLGESAILVLGPVATLVAVMASVDLSPYQPVWDAYWAAKPPILPVLDPGAHAVFFRSTGDNIRNVFRVLSERQTTVAIALLVTLGAAYTGHRAIRMVLGPGRVRGVDRLVWCASFLPPAFMFLLGFDFLRWSSMIVINVIVALLALMLFRGPPVERSSFTDNVRGQGRVAVAAMTLFMIYLCFPISSGVDWLRFPPGLICALGRTPCWDANGR